MSLILGIARNIDYIALWVIEKCAGGCLLTKCLYDGRPQLRICDINLTFSQLVAEKDAAERRVSVT